MPIYSIAEISSNKNHIFPGKKYKNKYDFNWIHSAVTEKSSHCILFLNNYKSIWAEQNLKHRSTNSLFNHSRAMETLNYLREYAAGFRMPDLSKIWYGQDEVDSGNNESLLIQVIVTFLFFLVWKWLKIFPFYSIS